MSAMLWPPCWPLRGHVKHVDHHGIKHHAHHARRPGFVRAARRAARAVVSKPAFASYVCIALWWPSPSYAPANGDYGGGREFGPIAHFYPPEAFGETPPFETAALIPPLFFVPVAMPSAEFAPVPDIPTVPQPGTQFPSPPETTPIPPEQPAPVPEPGSLALIGTALAALFAWRKA